MTDVYLAYAREDRESVRILSEMLQFEGWDVWLDPSEPAGETSAAVDMKLASAGAIIAVWSGYSRHSDYVRSEAATGLYKNKLIQVALDTDGAPSPFDQAEAIDLRGWTGERDNSQWRRVTAAVRLYAGAPGSARPMVQHRAVSGRSISSGAARSPGARSLRWVCLCLAVADCGWLTRSAGARRGRPLLPRSRGLWSGSLKRARRLRVCSRTHRNRMLPGTELTARIPKPFATMPSTSPTLQARRRQIRCCVCSMRRHGSTRSQPIMTAAILAT